MVSPQLNNRKRGLLIQGWHYILFKWRVSTIWHLIVELPVVHLVKPPFRVAKIPCLLGWTCVFGGLKPISTKHTQAYSAKRTFRFCWLVDNPIWCKRCLFVVSPFIQLVSRAKYSIKIGRLCSKPGCLVIARIINLTCIWIGDSHRPWTGKPDCWYNHTTNLCWDSHPCSIDIYTYTYHICIYKG